MHWREMRAIAALFVVLAIQFCGGANDPRGYCSDPVWVNVASSIGYTANLRIDGDRPGQCTANFAAINDNPQVTFCWLLSNTTEDGNIVLKLPQRCGNSYISSRHRDNVVINDDQPISGPNDDRVWKVILCPKRTSNAFFTTMYQNEQIGQSIKYKVLAVKNGQLYINEYTRDDLQNPACIESEFVVYLYEGGRLNADQCESDILREIRLAAVYTTRIGKRQVQESLGRLLRLTITIGDDQYLVVRKRYANGTFLNDLQIEKLDRESPSTDSLFYYRSYTVADPDGETNELPDETVFTLMHALSRQYLTADVTSTALLNIGGNLTGLTFQDAENFPDSPLLDYRYFKVYKRHIGAGGNSTVYVCFLHFRSYCFLPASSDSLRAYPVDGRNTAGNPTFRDRSDAEFAAFSSASALLAGSRRVPTFGVYERHPVAAFGAPEVVFISEYSSSSGGSQSSWLRRVLSYDSTSNRIILTTRNQALQSPYRIVRQKWTEPGSSSIYISLSVITGSQPQFSSSGLWITRSSSSPVRVDSTFKSVDLDDRLFNSKCCLCSQTDRDDAQALFYNKGGNSVYLSIAQNGTLILRELVIPPVPNCLDNALSITTS